jgi:MerR family transcriptional regulator, copper efflux regulator
MTIGQAAKLSGVSAKMIRYYEQIGLISKAIRSDAGYRHYCESEVHSLRFIRRARDLGFSVEQISTLLVLWRDRDRASADVKAMALSHATGLKAKIAELQAMVQTLEHLADHCHGNERPDCPILADLAEPTAAAVAEQTLQTPHKTPRFGVDKPASSRRRSAAVTQS